MPAVKRDAKLVVRLKSWERSLLDAAASGAESTLSDFVRATLLAVATQRLAATTNPAINAKG